MRLLFAGTPEVALPSFHTLLGSTHELAAVLTRPAAPSGRGRHPRPSPVAQAARSAGVPVLTPRSLREDGVAEQLTELAPDAVAVVAYGNLVPPALLDLPRHGWVNLHFSLLPAWRGAAPVQHAIMAGDTVTGASTFRLEAGLDTGPVYATLEEEIRPQDTAGDLLDRLADSGAGLLLATLDELAAGTATPRPQPGTGVSLAPRITVAEAQVRWQDPVSVVDRHIRGCTPAPGAWTTDPAGQRLKVGPVTARRDVPDLPAGEIRAGRREVLVGTGTAAAQLGQVAPAGRSWMDAAAWARGARLAPGARLGAG